MTPPTTTPPTTTAPDGVRYWLPEENPDIYKALVALQRVAGRGLDPELVELIKIRASQCNGCAYCLHMHVSDALAMGIANLKVSLISVWREAGDHFTARERAALELTEYVTKVGERGVPDDVFARVRTEFDDADFGRVLASIAMINTWNRIALTGGYPAGLDERRA